MNFKKTQLKVTIGGHSIRMSTRYCTTIVNIYLIHLCIFCISDQRGELCALMLCPSAYRREYLEQRCPGLAGLFWS